jgi:hypothetical protein
MKLIILSVALVSILSACAKQEDKPYQPTSQEMRDKNDTSYYKKPESKPVENF